MNELTHLDLFSGIGGFALAAQRAGFRTVGFCECEPYAQAVLAQHWGAVLADTEELHGDGSGKHSESGKRQVSQPRERGSAVRIHPDITTLDATGYRGVTLLTGGFPCQPFSVAGKQRGAADDRHLWPHMLRVIKECRPAWVVGENVPGIIKMELDNCIFDLEAIGYAVQAFTVPACAVDAKHRRDRLWIVAYSDQQGPQGRDGAKLCECANQRTTRARDSRRDQPAIWCAEPAVGRVADGIPNRSHRLKGLGNAIVPQVAEPFFHWIAQIKRGEIV